MIEETFTAPSGTEFTYLVNEDGRFIKSSSIAFKDEDDCWHEIKGEDLVALAIHWIEREIVEIVADEDVTP